MIDKSPFGTSRISFNTQENENEELTEMSRIGRLPLSILLRQELIGAVVVQSDRMILTNGLFRWLHGLHGARVQEMPFSETIHTLDRRMVVERIGEQVMARREPQESRHRHVGADGTEIWTETFACPIEGADSSMFLYLVHPLPQPCLTDKMPFSRGYGTANELLAMIEALPFAALILDRDVVVAANQRLARTFGYTSHLALAGIKVMELIDPRDRHSFFSALEQTGGCRIPQEGLHLRWKKDSGEALGLETRLAFIQWGGAPWTLVLFSAADGGSGERMHPVRPLPTTGMETLVRGIAHDLNNALGVIIGYAERITITDKALTEPVQTGIESILKAVGRARELAGRLLSMGRQPESSMGPVDLEEIVDEALRFVSASLPDPIEIRRTVGPGRHMVLGDTTQLHQVVMNLCINAVQAIASAKGLLRVELDSVCRRKRSSREDRVETMVRLRIGDTGPGIPEEHLVHVFDPDFTTKTDGQGNGLGLAVVKNIIDLHGADIHVDSKPGKGTTFEVLIPLLE